MAKKIKKALKNVAKFAIPAAAIAALMGRQGKAFTNADARKLMTSNAAMRNSMLNNPFGGMMTAKDMAKDPFFINAETLMNDQRMFKKGGRVKKTKFSTKKKKQANKMRKK